MTLKWLLEVGMLYNLAIEPSAVYSSAVLIEVQ